MKIRDRAGTVLPVLAAGVLVLLAPAAGAAAAVLWFAAVALLVVAAFVALRDARTREVAKRPVVLAVTFGLAGVLGAVVALNGAGMVATAGVPDRLTLQIQEQPAVQTVERRDPKVITYDARQRAASEAQFSDVIQRVGTDAKAVTGARGDTLVRRRRCATPPGTAHSERARPPRTASSGRAPRRPGPSPSPATDAPAGATTRPCTVRADLRPGGAPWSVDRGPPARYGRAHAHVPPRARPW